MKFNKEVDILGKGESLKMWVKHSNVSAWSINDAFQRCVVPVDRILFFDDIFIYPKPDKGLVNKTTIEELNNTMAEIVSRKKYEGLHKNSIYPLSEISVTHNCYYFVNTLAYALALAIWEGYQVINLFGCDFQDGCADLDQIGGVQFWIGFARAKNITINLTPYSRLMPDYRYGYEVK